MKIPKLKKKAFSINLNIYPFTIFVGFLDINLLIEEFKRYKYPPNEEAIESLKKHLKLGTVDYGAITVPLDSGNIVIFIPGQVNESSYMINMITHESFHATEMILDRIGLTLCGKTDEAYCYLNGFINQEIFKQI